MKTFSFKKLFYFHHAKSDSIVINNFLVDICKDENITKDALLMDVIQNIFEEFVSALGQRSP